MPSYIALLRGINVSGQKKIKMADLRVHLADLDYQNIRTYIQSGNIVFETTQSDLQKLEKQIRSKIDEQYGFDVPTLVKTAAELEHVLTHNPFLNQEDIDPKRLYFTFLSDTPAPDRVEHLKTYDYSPEQYILEGKDIYFYCPQGYGRAKMNNNFFEQKLKVQATTRNLKTTRILWEMAVGS
jgi:uncharacterized protein (DUF1697 family)